MISIHPLNKTTRNLLSFLKKAVVASDKKLRDEVVRQLTDYDAERMQ